MESEEEVVGINSDYRMEELSGDEVAALAFEAEHRHLKSCQSDDESNGESDLSLTEEGE
jgi:hypothetical protein